MKTICLLLNKNDEVWFKKLIKSDDYDQLIVIAPTFEGELLAISLGVQYKSYNSLAFELDKKSLNRQAQNMSLRWIEKTQIDSLLKYKNYPLFLMHHSRLTLIFNEILQATEFIYKILDEEKPARIVFGKRENPFNEDLVYFITCSNGLEREAARVISRGLDIECFEIIIKPSNSYVNKLRRVISNPNIIWERFNSILTKKICNKSNYKSQVKIPDDVFRFKSNILIFSTSEYYLKQLTPIFNDLIDLNFRITLFLSGKKLPLNDESYIKQLGVDFYYKSEWVLKNESEVLAICKEKSRIAFESIKDSIELKTYFSNESFSYYGGLINDAIKHELINEIPLTICELKKTENIIDIFKPNLVISHFAIHPLETANILPAISKGIPTLSLTHGICSYYDSERDTNAAEYYAVEGSIYREALLKSVQAHPEKVIPVGQTRLENIKITSESSSWKNCFGYDKDKPLCIYCDNSVWSHALTFRHSTFERVKRILELKMVFPDLQIILRFHHGPDYTELRNYIERLKIKGVFFQVSPTPIFTEIIKAADFIISDHTSAITEALLSGVRVIYLSALSICEHLYKNCESILVAEDFDILNNHINFILNNPVHKKDVLKMSQAYFNNVLMGNDGRAKNRLVNLIVKLSKLDKKKEPDFSEWVEKIYAACNFPVDGWRL
jgi:hypothetical protein